MPRASLPRTSPLVAPHRMRIDEAAVAAKLYTAGLPDPELIIRTSGELRLSNYLLWQAAYSEFYITSTYWPDFDRWGLIDAILTYQGRDAPLWRDPRSKRFSRRCHLKRISRTALLPTLHPRRLSAEETAEAALVQGLIRTHRVRRGLRRALHWLHPCRDDSHGLFIALLSGLLRARSSSRWCVATARCPTRSSEMSPRCCSRSRRSATAVLLTVVIFLFMLAIGLWYVSYAPRAYRRRLCHGHRSPVHRVHAVVHRASARRLAWACRRLTSHDRRLARRCGSPTPSPTSWARRLASIRWRRGSVRRRPGRASRAASVPVDRVG